MESVLTGAVRDVVAAVEPERTAVQREMEARAEETDFPVVGPEVGGLLALLARAVGARRVFEFGSGFGYSASWIAPVLPADGLVVLTEFDTDLLDRAREYFEADGLADRAAFEAGDAFDAFERYDGPFDLVLVDCEKRRYPTALERVRPKLAPGGLVVADNTLQARYGPADVAAGFESTPGADVADAAGEAGEVAEDVAGIVEYLRTTRDDPALDTSLVPLGEGIAISRYRGEP